MNKRRFKGLAYPITKHPKGFFRNADSDLDEIKSSIATIILTNPSERIFEPYFGTNLNGINLNAPKELAIAEIRMKVASSLKRWEKRMQVREVRADIQESDGQVLLIIIVYFTDPIDIAKVHELTIYKSLGGVDGRPMPF